MFFFDTHQVLKLLDITLDRSGSAHLDFSPTDNEMVVMTHHINYFPFLSFVQTMAPYLNKALKERLISHRDSVVDDGGNDKAF